MHELQGLAIDVRCLDSEGNEVDITAEEIETDRPVSRVEKEVQASDELVNDMEGEQPSVSEEATDDEH